jgi:hypothetical protein
MDEPASVRDLWAPLPDASRLRQAFGVAGFIGSYETYVSAPISPMSPVGPIQSRSPKILHRTGASRHRAPPS